MLICGTGSFTNHDDSPSPKQSKRNTRLCKMMGRDTAPKNPYSDRGLDKFYALLAHLHDKKQKIYTQKGSQDIRFVRFIYTNDSNIVKPIVVKVRHANNLIQHPNIKAGTTPEAESTTVEDSNKSEIKNRRSLRCKGSSKVEDLRRPRFFFSVMVVLILLFIAIYGRSFAILCTSIAWYLAPTIAGGISPAVASERKGRRKKSDEAPSSPKSHVVIDGNGFNQVQS